jgi:SAM-dependent methyltransferase
MSKSMKEHWNTVYASKPIDQLGWYEPHPTPSLQLIEQCALDRQAAILDIGSGATTLLQALLDQGYQQIYALDISETALEKARTELGAAQAVRIQWLVDDITHPSKLLSLPQIALWHDRAVLHFFTDAQQRQDYLATLLKILRPGGYVIIAAFATGGASKCSGLDVRNYDRASLMQFLGPHFELIASLDYTYHMPSGDVRPYIYTLFQRKTSLSPAD